MKKTLVGLAGTAILLSSSLAMANQVQIITDQFYSVGNRYDELGNNEGNFNPSSQDLGVNTYQIPDGHVDSLGIGNLLRIEDMDTGAFLFQKTIAEGLTFVISGTDDVLFNPTSGTSANLYSLGMNIKVYTDTPPDFDARTPATAENGILLLDLQGHALSLAGLGFNLTNDETGLGSYDLEEDYNFNTNTYTGSALLDVIGGSWMSLWDTNMQRDGADLAFSFSLDPLNNPRGQYTLSGTANGVGAPIPEPATMLLFGAGLIGLAGISRRKMRK